jgi:hypothetical protein
MICDGPRCPKSQPFVAWPNPFGPLPIQSFTVTIIWRTTLTMHTKRNVRLTREHHTLMLRQPSNDRHHNYIRLYMTMLASQHTQSSYMTRTACSNGYPSHYNKSKAMYSWFSAIPYGITRRIFVKRSNPVVDQPSNTSVANCPLRAFSIVWSHHRMITTKPGI